MRINNELEAVLILISTIAMILQLYTIFVVITKSPPAMKEYRYFLCYYTFSDFCYNFVMGYLLAPSFLFPAPAIVVNGFADDLANIFGYNTFRVSLALFIGCAVYVVQSQDYCLMYRFCVIHENPTLQKVLTSWPGKVIAQIIGLFIAVSLTIPAYLSISSLERLPIFERDQRDSILKYVIPGSKYVFLDYTYESILRPLVLVIVGLFGLSETLCFILAFYILKILKKNAKNFSQRTYKLHQQLTRILIFQLITPIVCIVFPITAGIYCVMTGTPLNNTSGGLGFLGMTIYPIFNALITIIFVSPYWQFTKSWLQFVIWPFRTKNKNQHVVFVPSITTFSSGFARKTNSF